MVSLLVHAILGIVVIAIIVKSNPGIFKRAPQGPQLSALEIVFYIVGIVSLPLCWYFNIRYVQEYAPNPMIGQPNWSEFIAMGYANPASSSGRADYTIGNVILLPLFTIIDGRRRGIRRPWLFFVSSRVHQLRVRLRPSTWRPSSGNAGTNRRRHRSNPWPDGLRLRPTVDG